MTPSYFCVIITECGRVITTSKEETLSAAYRWLSACKDVVLVAHIVGSVAGTSEIIYTWDSETWVLLKDRTKV